MMEKLSNSSKLGVIILANQFLVKLGFKNFAIIEQVAAKIGTSTKSGYQAKARLLELLRSQENDSYESLKKGLLCLKIRNQVLAYERDHPGVRFGDPRNHLPLEAREICVRILREFHHQLPEPEIAVALGVPLSSLRRWGEEADSSGKIPQKPERRGAHNRMTKLDEDRVVELYKALERELTLEEFSEIYQATYADSPLDRRTITRVLETHGLKEIETRDEAKPYHGRFKVFFPGAQASIDAKEVEVSFASQPEKSFKAKGEVAYDIASGAILGNAVGKEETAEGVSKVLIEASAECESTIALLSDNGSANRSAAVQAMVEKVAAEGHLYSFPYHPQTNGHVEGLFGQFSRIVGKIILDDSCREALVQSLVAVIMRVYIYFHNHSPRKRLAGRSPLEYFRAYAPRPEELERARRELAGQKKRSQARHDEHSRLSDPVFTVIVKRLLTEFHFEVEPGDALRALLPYDASVIESAERAFLVYSQRDGFDERKRSFAYFMGIVKNKQKELDQEKIKKHLAIQQNERRRAEEGKKKAQAEEDLQQNPEKFILASAKVILAGKFRFVVGMFVERLRKGLAALIQAGRGSMTVIHQLSETIRNWGNYPEDLKERMVKILMDEYQKIVDSS